MNCKHCGEEFEAKRSDARYCGNVCRAAYAKRTQLSAPSASAPASVPYPTDEYQLTPEQLADLPTGVTKPGTGPDWAHTTDYRKIIHRLVNWPLKRLEEAGIWIPAWRRLEG